MLTNGWRRFRWEEILKNKSLSFEFAPEFAGHVLTGKVANSKTGEIAREVEGFASVPGVRTQLSTAKSDGNGNVNFEMRNMYGSAEVIVQTNLLQDSMYRIDISNPFSSNYTAVNLDPFTLPSDKAATLLDHSIGTQVQNIYSGQKLKQFNNPVTDTSTFYLQPELHYNLDDYTRFTTMEEVLREYVQFVDVRKRAGQFYLLIYNTARRVPSSYSNPPLILLDGVPVNNVNKLMDVDPFKIRRIEVITANYFYGSSFFQGLVNFVSYEGNLANYELDPKVTVLDYEGLQLQREFYSPRYGNSDVDSHIPDFRNVLYWSSDLKTNENGESAISFYTSDMKGKYAVVVQGISTNGKCGEGITFFEVK
jgi:hypothetical protein